MKKPLTKHEKRSIIEEKALIFISIALIFSGFLYIQPTYIGYISYDQESNQTISKCSESWSCTEWNNCANNVQSRSCADSNNCNSIKNKPKESKPCTSKPQDNLTNAITQALPRQTIKVLPERAAVPGYFAPTFFIIIIFFALMIFIKKLNLPITKQTILTSIAHYSFIAILILSFVFALIKSSPVGAFMNDDLSQEFSTTSENDKINFPAIAITAFIIAIIYSLVLMKRLSGFKVHIRSDPHHTGISINPQVCLEDKCVQIAQQKEIKNSQPKICLYGKCLYVEDQSKPKMVQEVKKDEPPKVCMHGRCLYLGEEKEKKDNKPKICLQGTCLYLDKDKKAS